MSKAVGVMGGYIAGRQHLKDFLIQRCRPLLFSTSQPPAVAAACIAAIDVLENEPERIERLWDNARFFKSGLQDLGFDTGISETPITPVIAGDEAKAQQLAARLFERGRLRDLGRLSHGAARARRACGRSSPASTRATTCRPASTPSARRSRIAPDLMAAANGRRWVCLDVGETLIDETRVWSIWADLLDVPRFTFMAALGAVLARGQDHRAVFDLVGRPGWEALRAEFEAALRRLSDRRPLPRCRSHAGRPRDSAATGLAILANQPAMRTAELACAWASAST